MLNESDILINKIPDLESDNEPLLKILEVYNTSLFHQEENGKANVVPVLMIEYIVTLASILDAVDWICNSNLLSPERIFRLTIQDAKSKSQHKMQTFGSSNNDESKIYGALFKGLDNSKIEFKVLENYLIDTFNNSNK